MNAGRRPPARPPGRPRRRGRSGAPLRELEGEGRGDRGATSSLDWTILKPSLQFGEGDGFFNVIAGLVRNNPVFVPVPGRGTSRFQPVHVGDVSRVVVRAFADPTTIGEAYELGGPHYWTYREIIAEVLAALGAKRTVVPMPVPLIALVAGAAEVVHLPFPVATDQLRQLRLDNVGPLGLIRERFGFEPRDHRWRPRLPAATPGRPGATRRRPASEPRPREWPAPRGPGGHRLAHRRRAPSRSARPASSRPPIRAPAVRNRPASSTPAMRRSRPALDRGRGGPLGALGHGRRPRDAGAGRALGGHRSRHQDHG